MPLLELLAPAIDSSIAYADQYIARAILLGWLDAAQAMNKQIELFKFDLSIIQPDQAIDAFQRIVDAAMQAMDIELESAVTL